MVIIIQGVLGIISILARGDSSSDNNTIVLPQPLYSPDLAFVDFFPSSSHPSRDEDLTHLRRLFTNHWRNYSGFWKTLSTVEAPLGEVKRKRLNKF